MKTSISMRPKNVVCPAGHIPLARGTLHDSSRKWALYGIMNTVSMSKMMKSTATM